MTMKLKWLLFWKSLKQLFIISLISCFTFWLGCFASSWYVFKFNTTYPGPFDSNYDINVFWKWIPLTSSLWYSKKMLFITNGRYMFWQENQLPYVYSNGIYWQINFYKVCPSLWWTWNPFWTSSCSSYPCSVSYWQNNCSQTNISDAEETKNIIWTFFNTLNQSSDYYYIHYVNNLTMFCFYSSSLDKIMCFFQPSSSNWTNYWANFDWISSSLLFNPPSYSPSWWENSWWWNLNNDIIYTYSWLLLTNSWIYQGLLNMWYYQWLCYWDYNSWSLVDTSEWFSQFFDWWDCQDSDSYCWMTLLDLFNSSSSSVWYSKESWFKNYYNLMKMSYEKNDLSNWNWRYKSLWKIMFKVYNTDFTSDWINLNWYTSMSLHADDYFTFCKMTLDIKDWTFNWWDTWDKWWDYSLNDNTSENIINNREIQKNTYEFILSWANSSYSWESNMLWLFNDMFQRFKGAFKVDSSLSNIQWILPTYIIFGFFLFVLLYWLKR